MKILRKSMVFAFFLVKVTTQHLTEIAGLIDDGRLRIRGCAVLLLAQAREAHLMLEGVRPRPKGKIVLSVGRPTGRWVVDSADQAADRSARSVTHDPIVKARAPRSDCAAKANATTWAVVREIQGSDVDTLAGIARALQARGVKTPPGRSEWQAVRVSRILVT